MLLITQVKSVVSKKNILKNYNPVILFGRLLRISQQSFLEDWDLCVYNYAKIIHYSGQKGKNEAI